MTKVAVYVRVSTQGQTYEQQVVVCKNYCKMKGWDEIDVFSEKESSTKLRPVFEDCLRQARSGHYKTIVVFRLDRAWRSSRQFIMDFDSLQAKGISIISISEGLDPTTPLGKCMMTILVALAELERVNISEATRQRLQSKKRMGIHIGRPFGSKDSKKRSTDGYYKRWEEVRGSKKPLHFTPVRIDLKKENE